MEESEVGLKKTLELKEYRKLEQHVRMKPNVHFCCAACAAVGVKTPLCNMAAHCQCHDFTHITNESLTEFGSGALIYTRAANTLPAAPIELRSYGSAFAREEKQMCRLCNSILGVRIASCLGHIDEIVLLNPDGLVVRPRVEGVPPVPAFFLIEKSKVKLAKVEQGEA